MSDAFDSTLGLRFEQIANPIHFAVDPHLAWGFYGHRMHLYRENKPHQGYHTLQQWAASKAGGHFVFTSNVDGQFVSAGFDENRVVECHGSIHHLQCSEPCDTAIWSASDVDINIDPDTMRATDPLPRCPYCGLIARPNILMFGDAQWISARTSAIDAALDEWILQLAKSRLCILEFGAGLAIPTVRSESERIARKLKATMIRVNVREPQTPDGHISLPLTAAEAIRRIAAAM